MLPSPTPRQILVICTRRIGDVLLATPAVRALRQTFADTAVDMLVFEGAQGVVAANPDLRRVVTVRERLSIGAHLRLLRRIWRRYDVAVSLLMGDRPILYAWAAGKDRVGTLMIEKFGGWKRQLLHRWVVFDNLDTHTVQMNLKVIEQLGVHQRARPVVAWREEDAGFAREACQPLRAGKPYAVLHVSPKYAYKTWTAPGGSELGRWLDEHGMQLVIAGGGAAEELRYIDSLLPHFPDNTLNLAGRIGGIGSCVVPNRFARRDRHGRDPHGSGLGRPDCGVVRSVQPGEVGAMARRL